MQFDNNIYKRPTAKVQGMSSRQQVLFLMQKTQKEANWNIENDSDFQDDYSQETYPTQNAGSQSGFSKNNQEGTQLTYNQEYDLKRFKLRQVEFKNHPERFRLLAYSLTQFIPIKKNKYLERKRYLMLDKEANALVCTCQKSSAKKNEKTNPHQSYNCGERCINRCVSTECCLSTCPSGQFCKNRRFQLHQNAYVYPAKTEKKGWGLFAGELIQKGTFIMQYVGEVFSTDTDLGQQRVEKYKNSTCTYLMRTTNGEVIDPTFVGNIARFINHSCDPNCETQKWNVLGEVCVGIFALRDIKENEELSFDYQFDFFKTPFTKCYCGSSKCKGFLGVLPTTTEINNGDYSSSPQCAICSKAIIQRDQLMVCSGFCKDTFHISCIISKEMKNKASQQAFLQQLDKKNFFCKKCCKKISLKRRQVKRKQLDDEFRLKEAEAAHFQAAISGENVPENPQEDKDVDVPPWESKDPSVRQLFEDSSENKQMDGTILKECEMIEEMVKELVESMAVKGQKSKRKNAQFCPHYVFMCEFQKRMKMRVKGSMKHFKFRKLKDLASIKPTKSRSRQPRRTVKNRDTEDELQQELKTIAQVGQVKRSQARRPRKQDQMGSSKDLSQQSNTSEKKKYPRRRRKVEDPDEESKGEVEDEQMSEIDEDADEEDSGSSSDDNEEAEEEEEEDIDEEHLDSEDEDEEEEAEEEEDDEESESAVRLDQDELNLEQLQCQEQSLEEEEEDQEEGKANQKNMPQVRLKLKNSMDLDSLLTDQPASLTKRQLSKEESALKRNLKHLSADDDQESMRQRETSDNFNSRKTPMKLSLSPRKNSLLLSFVKRNIEDFVLLQNKIDQTAPELVFKESKFNLYETVFYFVVPDHIDELQCLPSKFQIYWEQSWGGMVTVRLISTLKQYEFFTRLFQEVSDYLLKYGTLGGRHLSNQLMFEKQQSHSQGSLPKIVTPFDIVMLQVPKNFLRQLVGYQERKLNFYRKKFSVDFFYNKELLNDEVYQMNETTAMRIFGRTSEVFIVNEEIHKYIETLSMKTMLLQTQDCKSVMDNVKEVKAIIDPCEIRVKRCTKDKDWKDLKHPFYYCPNYFRELVLIGNLQEIEMGESRMQQFLKQRRDARNIQQICFLLPQNFKYYQQEVKVALEETFPEVKFFFYDPTFPRKHITVLFMGPWGTLIRAKDFLEKKSNEVIQKILPGNTFQNFQQFTFHQQVRFTFKSLKRYNLEQDIKYLNHWDLCYHFVETAGLDLDQARLTIERGEINEQEAKWQRLQYGMNPFQIAGSIDKEKKGDYELFIRFLKETDQESCINTLYVLSENDTQLCQLMKQFQVTPKELIIMMANFLKVNIEEFQEAMKLQRANYEPFKIIADDEEGEQLVIQQSRDRRRYSRSRSYNRDIDIREELNRDRRNYSRTNKQRRSRSPSSGNSRGHSREEKHYRSRGRNTFSPEFRRQSSQKNRNQQYTYRNSSVTYRNQGNYDQSYFEGREREGRRGEKEYYPKYDPRQQRGQSQNQREYRGPYQENSYRSSYHEEGRYPRGRNYNYRSRSQSYSSESSRDRRDSRKYSSRSSGRHSSRSPLALTKHQSEMLPKREHFFTNQERPQVTQQQENPSILNQRPSDDQILAEIPTQNTFTLQQHGHV